AWCGPCSTCCRAVPSSACPGACAPRWRCSSASPASTPGSAAGPVSRSSPASSGSASRSHRPVVSGRILRRYGFTIAGIAIGVAGIVAGRELRAGDRGVAVVGASFATSHGLGVGSTLTLEGEPYQVVGVLQRTLTAPDRFVMVAIEDARRQWVAKDRMLRTIIASGAAAVNAADLNTGAAVGWRDGEDPDAVARRITERVEGVNVQIPSELSALLRSSTAF